MGQKSYGTPSKPGENTIKNLKMIQPETWNNVAIPVVEAINILKNEIAGFNY